jgi:multidrug efflux pump subunit AcrA (membrane-fusion protein)
MKQYLLPVLAAGAALFATVSVVRTQPVREVTEPVSAPPASSFTDTVAAVGLIEASTEHISVGTPLSGVVTEVLVTLNQSVRAGTPLFRLDTRALQASLAVHESQLTAARARQATAQCQVEDLNDRLERSLKLRSSTVISEDELIRTRFALKVSQARAVEAQAEVAPKGNVGDPLPVLHHHRLVQPETVAQVRRGVLVDHLIARREGGNVGGDIVPRRELDQYEGQEADGHQERQHP